VAGRWCSGDGRGRTGHPVPTVLDLAEQHDADLLIMASHGRAGLDAILTGSVAPRIAGRVGRPLLLVRAGEAA
jgi:nucleotide-binding universal stress UspA family protein